MDIDPVIELQRCFALVRPVGMTDGATRDWLAAAAAEVRHIPPATLARACAEVRKTATHHGQIIPAIIAAVEATYTPDPFRWAMVCHQPSRGLDGYLTDDRGETRLLGDVVKGLGYDDAQ